MALPAFTTRPEIEGSFGVAASTHWIASSVAMGILERGGNAFDAAVAGGFALQVVEPHLNGPGGEVPILLCPARTGRIEVICGQGPAPAAATPERFAALGLDLIPGSGLLPAVVPGAFGAWLMLLRDHGTLELRDVLAPALHYAETGYPVVPRIAEALATVAPMFRAHWPSSAEIYAAGPSLPRAGDTMTNPALAATYRRVIGESDCAGGGREARIEAARGAWYRGFVAEAIDRFHASARLTDSTGEAHGGLLTGDDLARWEPAAEAPVMQRYGRFTVAKCGPWSQGPVMLQQLALLDGLPLGEMAPDGPEFIHVLTEAAKLAFADREAWYGDPAHVGVPLDALVSADYARTRRDLIGAHASGDLRPGAPEGRAPRMPRFRAAGAGSPDVASMLGLGGAGRDGAEVTAPDGVLRGDTCHIDVIDRHGNMVSATPSGGWFQSSPVVPGLGFGMSTRMQMFWLDPGLPGTLRPGARPRTTLTPSMALRDDAPYLAWGTPGGDQQDQWSLQAFLKHVHHGMNLQEAIDSPAFHSEHWQSSFWPREARPNRLVLEGRIPSQTAHRLAERGHDVETGGDWSEGRLSAASREMRHGRQWLRAAANPRGMQGYAVGR